jgi:glycosyltransferase involved in cell wall biosynthesis
MSELRVRYAGDLSNRTGIRPRGSALARAGRAARPVLGFLALTSGAQEGAIIRDMRLANELHRRGYKVVVYWMMERKPSLLRAGIRQRVLVRGLRYWSRRPNGLIENASRILDLVPERGRRRFIHRRSLLVARILRNFVAGMCNPEPDPALIRRLLGAIAADGVTHLMATHAMTAPLLRAAKQAGQHDFDYLVTIQGEEIFASFIGDRRRTEDYYRQLRRALEASPWPAVVVSNDYALRLESEIGLAQERMSVIYPGIEVPGKRAPKPSFDHLTRIVPWLRRDLPIVSYFGRQDAEKGIDLLLYAARMLRERGHAFQLMVAGSASFGRDYEEACQRIAQHLRLELAWKRELDDETRGALYAFSRCVVCPSIHREPFGMVVPEAMAHGTPVLVPDHGGVTETIAADGKVGGITFRAWDSRDLADQLERLLLDDELHVRLSADGPALALRFTIEAMADRVLAHMGVPTPN